MSGLFQLLGVGAQSLGAQQLAEANAGNNAANAATPGYSRRRVLLAEAPPAGPNTGGGVTATGLERLRAAMADHQYRADSRDLAFAQAEASVLSSVSALLSPTGDTALGNALNGLFAAFGDLAARPDDASVRQVVVTEAQAVADAAAVSTARSSERALVLLSEDRFDDVQMAGRDGVALVEAIATWRPELLPRVVLNTGYAYEPRVVGAVERHAVTLLEKGCPMSELFRTLETVARRS
jgi:CheY-like chemotaxis protein